MSNSSDQLTENRNQEKIHSKKFSTESTESIQIPQLAKFTFKLSYCLILPFISLLAYMDCFEVIDNVLMRNESDAHTAIEEILVQWIVNQTKFGRYFAKPIIERKL